MDQHTVRTARGGFVNMMELRNKAKRPLVMGDQKDKIEPQKQPPKQVNIQGFMPSMAGVVQPPLAEKPAEKERVVYEAVPEEDEQTMADVTGIIVDRPKFLKEKPGDPLEAADSTLKGIMGELAQYRQRKVEQDVKPTKRQKSS